MTTTRVPNFEDVRRDVNQFIDDYFATKRAESGDLDASYGALWQSLNDLYDAGGKRLRPYVLLLTYRAFGGTDYKKVLPIAAAIELLHAAMLIHDDVMDKDYMRHGSDNLAGMYMEQYKQAAIPMATAEHHAQNAAILGGDLMLSETYQIILDSAVTEQEKVKIMKQVGTAVVIVIAGQLLDTEATLRKPDQTDSLKVAKLKTAYYSFTAPMKIGAMLAGVGADREPAIEELSTSLGVSFQMADDLLGIFGDSKITGKSTLGDIREGKRTYLLNRTFELANESEKAILEKIIGNPRCDEAMAQTARNIMVSTSAKAEVLDLVQEYIGRATSALEKMPIESADKEEFEELIQKASRRAS